MIKCCCLLFVLLLSVSVLSAQIVVLDEDEYWQRLEQTAALTDSAQITRLWQGVESVRLDDGSIIPIDVSWLQTSSIQVRQKRIQVMLNHRSTSPEARDEEETLAILERLLQDETSETFPENEQDTPTAPAATSFSGWIQIILIIVALFIAGFTIIRITNALSIQRADLSPLADGEDPVTSEDAEAMAEQSQKIEDYRAAIRYLYLSLLLLLDEKRLIRYNPSLTNREHLEQIKDQPGLFNQLRPVIQSFDDVWYGYAPVDDLFYQGFRQQIEKLKDL